MGGGWHPLASVLCQFGTRAYCAVKEQWQFRDGWRVGTNANDESACGKATRRRRGGRACDRVLIFFFTFIYIFNYLNLHLCAVTPAGVCAEMLE